MWIITSRDANKNYIYSVHEAMEIEGKTVPKIFMDVKEAVTVATELWLKHLRAQEVVVVELVQAESETAILLRP
jgi:hypothetical protein